MNLSVLYGSNPRDVRYDPYPYVERYPALPVDVYAELEEARRVLDEQLLQSWGGRDNVRRSESAYHLLQDKNTPQCWKDFLRYHVSSEFWADIWGVFGRAITKEFPELERTKEWEAVSRYGRAVKKMDHLVILDCQVGINTPAKTTNSVRGPHVDNGQEVFACMLYMRPPGDESKGGDLTVYERRDRSSKVIFHDKAELNDSDVVERHIVPYEANRSFMWVNTPFSVHGVSPRHQGSPARLFISMCCEFPRKIFHLTRLES